MIPLGMEEVSVGMLESVKPGVELLPAYTVDAESMSNSCKCLVQNIID